MTVFSQTGIVGVSVDISRKGTFIGTIIDKVTRVLVVLLVVLVVPPAVAAQGELVLSLERMNRALDFDAVDRLLLGQFLAARKVVGARQGAAVRFFE